MPIEITRGFHPPAIVQYNDHFFKPKKPGDWRVKDGRPFVRHKIRVGAGWLCEQGVV